MGEHTIKALTGETWEAFAALCSRNNGGRMGACWCTSFHREKHSALCSRWGSAAPRTECSAGGCGKGRSASGLHYDGTRVEVDTRDHAAHRSAGEFDGGDVERQ